MLVQFVTCEETVYETNSSSQVQMGVCSVLGGYTTERAPVSHPL